MRVAKRIPKRVRKDDSSFKQRIEPQLPYVNGASGGRVALKE